MKRPAKIKAASRHFLSVVTRGSSAVYGASNPSAGANRIRFSGLAVFQEFPNAKSLYTFAGNALGLSAIRESRRHPVRAVATIIFRNGKGKRWQWQRMQASGADLPVL